ncbi:MAG: ribokinase [Acidobacteriota bacterium]
MNPVSDPPALVVIGSLNMDFVVRVERLPAPGETVLGGNFQMIPGGKGANQACAAGKLAGPRVKVRMAGRVGYDLFADHLKASLAAAGVDVSAVCGTQAQPTGVALIWVDAAGQNSIVVASGANHEFRAAEVEGLRSAVRGARAVLFQLETPLDAVAAALALARSEGAQTVLDPAPAQALSREMLSLVDILTPNESEALILLGRPPARVAVEDAPALARALRELGAKTVVLKMGDQGAYFDDGTTAVHQPAFRVEVKDSTAAGDVFNAGFAVGLTEGMPVAEALRFASAAAAISVTRPGAQASVPARREVAEFLRANA